jgi:ABC-type polysaccharide/polyol phosphate export permease
MRDLWTVMRLELKLYRRGKIIWIVGLIMALFGIWAASGIRELPFAAWTNFGITTGLFITLILTFSTRTAQQVIHLVQANIPPSFLPINFLWNRLFFLGLAILLVLLTVHSVGRQRQGAM